MTNNFEYVQSNQMLQLKEHEKNIKTNTKYDFERCKTSLNS